MKKNRSLVILCCALMTLAAQMVLAEVEEPDGEIILLTASPTCIEVRSGDDLWWECNGTRVTQIAGTCYSGCDRIHEFSQVGSRVYWKLVKDTIGYSTAYYSNSITGSPATYTRLTQEAEDPDWINRFEVVGDHVIWYYYQTGSSQSIAAYYGNSNAGGSLKRLTQEAVDSHVGTGTDDDVISYFEVGLGGRPNRTTWKFWDDSRNVEAYYYNCLTPSISYPTRITSEAPLGYPITNFQIVGDTAYWQYRNGSYSKVIASCQPIIVRTFYPTDDAWVNEDLPTVNYGSDASLRVRAWATGHGRHSYVKFVVSGLLPTSTVRSATFRVFIRDNELHSLDVYRMTDNVFNLTWQEDTVNWNNGSKEAVQIASATGLQPISWAEFDVSSYITGNGTYTIGIATTMYATGLTMKSKEGDKPPELIVEFE